MSIELPRDAEGREIPLDTQMLYTRNGIEFFIDKVIYERVIDEWYFFGHFGPNTAQHRVAASKLCLTMPDSWEKLEEDIRRIGTDDCTWFCGYANENPVENTCPDSCKFFKDDEITCRKKLADDILSRIRRLRGED